MANALVKLQELLVVFGLKLVAAIFILVVGVWLSGLLRRLVKHLAIQGGCEVTLISFISDLSFYSAITFVVLAALNQLGIQTASIIAILGAAGLAIGLALQGSLSNLAAGILMIVFRPFRVNDVIEGAGVAGLVEEIQILTTTLRTPDNKTIIIPNAKLYQDKIINYSSKPYRRVDLVFSVSYDNDLDRIKGIIKDLLVEDKRILTDPPPVIGIRGFANGNIDFAVRPWVMNQYYTDICLDLSEKAKKRFDAENIPLSLSQPHDW